MEGDTGVGGGVDGQAEEGIWVSSDINVPFAWMDRMANYRSASGFGGRNSKVGGNKDRVRPRGLEVLLLGSGRRRDQV